MNLFRSEEHVDRWLGSRAGLQASPAEPATRGQKRGGATITVTKLSELAHAWWSDRLAPGWRPHTRDQNQAILDRLGLTGEFWRLP